MGAQLRGLAALPPPPRLPRLAPDPLERALWQLRAHIGLQAALMQLRRRPPDVQPLVHPVFREFGAEAAALRFLDGPAPPDTGGDGPAGRPRVVVLSPSYRSQYTLTVCELLRRHGVEIAAVVIRRLADRRRLRAELRLEGGRLPVKIWRRLILGQRSSRRPAASTLDDLRRGLELGSRSVPRFCRRHGIPLVACGTFNDEAVVAAVQEMAPGLVVFTGGGLIRRRFLEVAGRGVVNCHMGLLPHYRGMDVVEWPLVHGRPDLIGFSVHLMDAGIDTGDILRTFRVAVAPGMTIAQLRERFEPLQAIWLARTCADFLRGEIQPTRQPAEAGKQYFRLHPELLELARSRLRGSP
jgi:folate-dependent phosphoribosylglycinamide formyltransferase PurN